MALAHTGIAPKPRPAKGWGYGVGGEGHAGLEFGHRVLSSPIALLRRGRLLKSPSVARLLHHLCRGLRGGISHVCRLGAPMQ